MSLVDAGVKSSNKKFKGWRTLAALISMLMGTAAIIWGTHNLLLMTEVPSCPIPVDEIREIAEENDEEADWQRELNEEQDPNSDPTSVPGGFGQIRVEIAGAVNKPGLYWLGYDSRVADLINLSGGLSSDADLMRINQQFNLASKLKDEQRIVIPYKQEKEIEEWMAEYCLLMAGQSAKAPHSVNGKTQDNEIKLENTESGKEEVPTMPTSECVSINNANNAQLQTLTGVGEKTAELIIEGRPYSKINELLEVKGIGDATLEKLEPFICL